MVPACNCSVNRRQEHFVRPQWSDRCGYMLQWYSLNPIWAYHQNSIKSGISFLNRHFWSGMNLANSSILLKTWNNMLTNLANRHDIRFICPFRWLFNWGQSKVWPCICGIYLAAIWYDFSLNCHLFIHTAFSVSFSASFALSSSSSLANLSFSVSSLGLS